MAGAKNEFLITATSVTNFYDVLSSNGWDHYPLIINGFQTVRCGCPRGELNLNCKHRTYALESIAYIDEDAFYGLAQLEMDIHQWRAEMGWLDTLEKISVIEDREAAEELFSTAA